MTIGGGGGDAPSSLYKIKSNKITLLVVAVKIGIFKNVVVCNMKSIKMESKKGKRRKKQRRK